MNPSDIPTPRTNEVCWCEANGKNSEVVLASFSRQLEQELQQVRDQFNKDRDGNWCDKFGACKVCDGEIPHGHTDKCDIYKMEQEIRQVREELAEVRTNLWHSQHGKYGSIHYSTLCNNLQSQLSQAKEEMALHCACQHDEHGSLTSQCQHHEEVATKLSQWQECAKALNTALVTTHSACLATVHSTANSKLLSVEADRLSLDATALFTQLTSTTTKE